MPDNNCAFETGEGSTTYSCPKETESGGEYCIWHQEPDEKSANEIIDRLKAGGTPPRMSKLSQLQFDNFDFEEVDLTRARFDSSELNDVGFRSCNLSGVEFIDSKLIGVEFINSNLDYTRFGGETLVRDSRFERGVAEGFKMKSVRCENTDFVSFEVRDGSFYETDILGGECSQFNVRGTNLNLLNFRRTDLENCIVDGGQAKSLEFNGGKISSMTLSNRLRSSYRFLGLDQLDITLKGEPRSKVEIQNCSETEVDSRLEELETLRATAVDGTNISIRNGTITELTLKEMNLKSLRLDSITANNCILEQIDVDHRTDFEDITLKGGEIKSVSFSTAKIADAVFDGVDSDKFHLLDAKLTNVQFKDGKHDRARLPNAQIKNCKYKNVVFNRGTHREAVIDDKTNFDNTSFDRVNFEQAVLNGLELGDTSLERAILRGCDFRTTGLSGVRFYDAHLLDLRLNEETDFGEKCIYEEEVDEQIGAKETYSGVQSFDRALIGGIKLLKMWNKANTTGSNIEDSLEKAVRTYRDYQRVLRENSLRDQIPHYRIRERDTQRKLALVRGDISRWFRLMIERWSMKYGEGASNIIYTSFAIILIWTFFYLASGGLRVVEANGATIYIDDSNPVTEVIGWLLINLPIAGDNITAFSRNLYFSVVTFTTLGFGDIQPATQATRYLAAIESFFGAVLMALLVYVLGRRATW